MFGLCHVQRMHNEFKRQPAVYIPRKSSNGRFQILYQVKGFSLVFGCAPQTAIFSSPRCFDVVVFTAADISRQRMPQLRALDGGFTHVTRRCPRSLGRLGEEFQSAPAKNECSICRRIFFTTNQRASIVPHRLLFVP